ncbi:MAG: cell division protein FtsB [Betaproteobacteria bacterium]|nr:cell division protein FtsB [Betaproteobacteria bacterium]
MKALTLIFVILIALLQYPLWLGKGSWLRVWDLNRQVTAQQEKNHLNKVRNDMLEAEVRDLKSGQAAIEERARSELGMIKQDEVFYQTVDQPLPPPLPAALDPIKPPQLEKKVEKRANNGGKELVGKSKDH